MSNIGHICDFIMNVLFYAFLYSLLSYVYAQGKQIGHASATAPETETAREPERSEWEGCGGAHPSAHRAEDPYVLLRCWRACMAGTRPSDWELIVSHLLIDTDAALAYADATAREIETGDTQWRAEGICTAGVDVHATGYSIEVCR